jgi:hypothetical protein
MSTATLSPETAAALSKAALTAMEVQNASNLSGVALTFSKILTEVLWPAATELGRATRWVNEHPITHLFLDKMESLNRSQCLCSDCMNRFATSHDEVDALAHDARAKEVL